MNQNVFIYNNSMIDEINWMESWSIINTSIDDIKVYKCEYGDSLAYRLVF